MPVMSGDDFLTNGETQSCALGLSSRPAPETRKEVRQIGVRNARSLVANRDSIGFNRDSYDSAGGGVFDGILNHVLEQHVQRSRIRLSASRLRYSTTFSATAATSVDSKR